VLSPFDQDEKALADQTMDRAAEAAAGALLGAPAPGAVLARRDDEHGAALGRDERRPRVRARAGGRVRDGDRPTRPDAIGERAECRTLFGTREQTGEARGGPSSSRICWRSGRCSRRRRPSSEAASSRALSRARQPRAAGATRSSSRR